ncbi:hypothetical protein FEM48_Zijuj11G0002500 [Ziziphus jujuba var. spinosa]|uniref:Alcohol dehydrogenase-like 4 n=1 Tax=Ziziphus jujuba var. spinosa TaxID=714518 RepID=A0A978UFR0_ZIZJJ|nr:hypothetical protein FEM48_Zijuj11G0002500 [Ziziphus jujuba var. spinosa]
MVYQLSGSSSTDDDDVIAAVVWGPGQPFVMEEVRVQPPQKMEDESQRAYPRILGHEASGVVESVGEGVRNMEEGDYVVPIFNGECGECRCCKSEKTNICSKYGVNPFKKVMVNDGNTRFSTKDGKPIFHFLNTSTFSNYTVVDSACVVKIDSHLSPLTPKNMTLLSCGVSTGVGAAWNTANVGSGSTVAIFGLGAVGLAVAEGARARGASKIIGVDINSTKFIKGQKMGLTHFINPTDLDQPLHEGWGLTVVLGIHPTPRMLPLHPMELFNGRTIVGSIFGGFKGKTQLPHFAKQCMTGVVDLDKFITHELPFDSINDAFQLLVEGKSLRCLLHI